MIPIKIVDQVRALLAKKEHHQREIARLVGIAPGTVNSIATGKWREPRPHCDEVEETPGPAERCPECGYLVYMPCVRCCTLATEVPPGSRSACPTLPIDATELDEPLELNLRPEHRRRYERVKARRILESQTGAMP